jgi:F-box and WD-40 domain protein CDC4
MSNGAIRTVERRNPDLNADTTQLSDLLPLPASYRERPVSPESITEAEDPVGPSEIAGPTRVAVPETSRIDNKRVVERRPRALSNLRNLRNLNPATPDSESREQRRLRGRQNLGLNVVDALPLTPRVEQQETPLTRETRPTVPTTRANSSSSGPVHSFTSKPSPSPQSHCAPSDAAGLEPLPAGLVHTPPTEAGGNPPSFRPQNQRNTSAIPSRLNVMENPSATDGNLPSPSLSPVTAAANLQNAGYFADIDSNSELASQRDQDYSSTHTSFDDTPTRSRFASPIKLPHPESTLQPFASNPATSSINDIPAMLDFFDAIPDELKSYVMHQLLRRCPKPTLHVVADAVNPALKCDFLGLLPPELALNIVKFLDLRSMCRASQVSKKWRRLINCDEKHWKEMFDMDGFTLPEDELQRSITEGWGWQDPHGPDDFEQDISTPRTFGSESERPVSASSITTEAQKPPSSNAARRPKRKASSKLSNRNKQAKRREATYESPEYLENQDWMNQVSSTEGPYKAANAAIMAVPYPQVGLSSLKDLHLYKSLYRRHYLIRKNWLSEEAKPRHIAFRAHENHVVTCLQFDTDKILTGSDDNNINVYDTKTGAVRAKLGGHEGGVWALQYEGNTLVSGSTDRSVRVWNIEEGRQTHVFRGHTSTVRCLQILMPTKTGEFVDGKPVTMPKQPLIITGSRDSNLRIWKLPLPNDPEYCQEDSPMEDSDCPFFVRTLTGHQHSVRAIAAHGDTLVSGSYDCTVRVWKISTGDTVHRLQGHTQKVYSVVLDHARNRCISGSMDNLVKIWSLDTGSMLYTLDGHSSLVGLLDLNCERLVSAAADSTLRIWDPENGQCKATLSAHTGAITCFQHDAQKVISGSDRTLKMWNVKTGECIKDLLTDLSGVWQVKFNERRCVAAVQRDNMTYIEVRTNYQPLTAWRTANVDLGTRLWRSTGWRACIEAWPSDRRRSVRQ